MDSSISGWMEMDGNVLISYAVQPVIFVQNSLKNITYMTNITNSDLKLLKSCRAEITRGDRSLVNLLISRMNNAILIGRVKKKAGEPIVQPERWNHVMKNVHKQLEGSRLCSEYKEEFDYLIDSIFNIIHEVSCKLQEKDHDNR